MEPTIEHRPTRALKPWKRNARKHSKKQIRQIADSIEAFGFTNPVLVDEAGSILAGHGRVEAAKFLQLETVPCVVLEHMTPTQKRAYVIADNKLAENASWDDDLLSEELRELLDLDDGFDVGLTGFLVPEIDALLDAGEPEQDADPELDRLPIEAPSRVRRGDLWALGPHRLICGDSLDPATVDQLTAGEKARMVFTDPPYNVPVDGHVGGLGAVKHREFAMASGEMSAEEFAAFLTTAFQNLRKASVDGAIAFICMDWRHMSEMLAAGHKVFDELKNVIVWVKDNGGMGTFYRSRHELIFVWKSGSAPHLNTFELGQHGRYRTNVWEYRGVSSRSSTRDAELALHPTVKPVAMIADAIRDVSARGEIVLDLFGGSGSTLIAAELTGRRAFLAEYDEIYCDRILARWEAFAKGEAELIARATSEEDAA